MLNDTESAKSMEKPIEVDKVDDNNVEVGKVELMIEIW